VFDFPEPWAPVRSVMNDEIIPGVPADTAFIVATRPRPEFNGHRVRLDTVPNRLPICGGN
jgi:hypothetical protein